MNISKVIEKLEEIKRWHGDIKVKVQFRDDGGSYDGMDDFIYFNVEHDVLVL